MVYGHDTLHCLHMWWGPVCAVRVVEMQQEILDQQQAEEAAEADGAGPMSNLPAPRATRKWVSRPYSA
jgi:hypothetical protein